MDRQIDVEDENVNIEMRRMEQENDRMPNSDELLQYNKVHYKKNFIRLNQKINAKIEPQTELKRS